MSVRRALWSILYGGFPPGIFRALWPDIPEAARTGIIGSADGPIAVFIASPQNAAKSHMHRDVSSLYFETPEAIEWLMVFRKLPCEPIKKKLL